MEAFELRDNDKSRYDGKGVEKAINNIRNVIAPALIGLDSNKQEDIDEKMIQLDGTNNKANLGANAILAVSLAVARATSISQKKPLFQYLADLSETKEFDVLPIPMCNIINGGLHANNSIDFQEFMIVPIGASSFKDGIRWSTEVFHMLKANLTGKGLSTGVGDEGGFAPNLPSNTAAMDEVLYAINKAGYKAGIDFKVSIDSASSSFYEDSGIHAHHYVFKEKDISGKSLLKDSNQMMAMVKDWFNKYPILSWEDPLHEEDWERSEEHRYDLQAHS